MNTSKSGIRLLSRLGSRAVFGQAILDLAKNNQNFYVMSADLCSSSGLTRFAESYPDQFINAGIAEQNMVGVAGGLAKDGTPVFITSFAPFISMRASEQIRMNLGYMQLNIKAVALGSGLVMAQLGNSHYGLEDVAVMRSIPNITILSPADCLQITQVTHAALNHKGPLYIRLTGGPANPVVYKEVQEFKIGKANKLQDGEDVALIATGTMVHQALVAAQKLSEEGISASVIDMHTIKPLDTDCIQTLLSHKLIVTIEEHSIIGGLGGAVAEYLAPLKEKPPHLIIGIDDFFPHAGTYQYLLESCGLTGDSIARNILKFLNP